MMKYLAVVAVLVVTAISVYFYDKKTKEIEFSSTLTAKPDPNWEYIKSVLDQKKPETIDKFLEELKRKEPLGSLLFKSYALVHRSRSKQKATFFDPRVILFNFSLDRNIMLSFNGSKELEGYGSVEVITYDESEEAFKFRDIIFTKEATKSDFEKITEDEIEERTSSYWISKVNPSVCMDCHSKSYSFDPKPIWDAYFLWPGVYGGIDDELLLKSDKLYSIKNDIELDNLDAFQKIVRRDQHPRYSLLSPIKIENRIGSGARVDDERPNLLLNRMISRLMGRRAARQMDQNEQTRRYRNTILALSMCLDDTRDSSAEFFPEAPRTLFPPDIAALGRSLGAQDVKYSEERLKSYLADFNYDKESQQTLWDHNKGSVSAFRDWCKGSCEHSQARNLKLYVLLRRLSLDLKDWYTTFDGSIPTMFDGKQEHFFAKGYADVLIKPYISRGQMPPEFLKQIQRPGFFIHRQCAEKIKGL